MYKIDFLDYKTVLRYLIFFAVILIAGAIIKDKIAILIIASILFFAINQNLYRTIEVFLIWFFISNFFEGQGYITSEFISKYIGKPSFLLFIVFLFFIKRIPLKKLNARYIFAWIIFLLLTLLSSVSQGQSPFVIITISSFFIIYLVIQVKGFTSAQYQNILNLIVAVAILQTAVSFFQVSELIPPSTTLMDDGSGDKFEWIAGLDDVACGTFGPGASHITSWYSALISLFLLLVWSITKNRKYLIFTTLVFLQLSTADSKIIVGVTILMLCYMIFYIYKEKSIFKINIERYFIFIFILVVGFMGFLKAWNTYYQYYGEKTGGTRTDISAVFEIEGKESIDLIYSNIGDWGKIKGYQYIYEDFVKNDPKQLIWGYGIQGYDYNSKMGYIQTKDAPEMQLNNLTNSISGLTTQFARSGFVGFTLFIISILIWSRYNTQKNQNKFDLIKISLLKIFLPFTLLAAFLYSIELVSIPIITFAAIIAIYGKMSKHYELSQSDY